MSYVGEGGGQRNSHSIQTTITDSGPAPDVKGRRTMLALILVGSYRCGATFPRKVTSEEDVERMQRKGDWHSRGLDKIRKRVYFSASGSMK